MDGRPPIVIFDRDMTGAIHIFVHSVVLDLETEKCNFQISVCFKIALVTVLPVPEWAKLTCFSFNSSEVLDCIICLWHTVAKMLQILCMPPAL